MFLKINLKCFDYFSMDSIYKVYLITFMFSCYLYMSRRIRKPTVCICENKDADQLYSNCAADQRLCFRYTDSTTPILLKSEISTFKPFSVTVQTGLCRTWSETQIVGFLMRRLISIILPCSQKLETALFDRLVLF